MIEATQLIWRAAGCPVPCDVSGEAIPRVRKPGAICARCGVDEAPYDVSELLSANFVPTKNANRIAAYGGRSYCSACVFAARTLRLRCISWFASSDGISFWATRSGDPIARLLDPPSPPFVCAIPDYGIAHGGEAHWQRTWWPRESHPDPLVKLQSKHVALCKTVLEAARERIAFVFDSHEQIIVSISGGKDSTVLAHLALVEAKRRGRKIGLYFLDEEVVYESTVKQVDALMAMFPENITKLWLQLEFRLTNATSTTEGQLVCWEAGKHKEWMRPKKSFAIQHPPWDRATQTVRNRAKGFGFYDAIENFESCYHGAAFLVGLRAAGESPNRWRAVTRNPIEISGRRVYWGTRKGANDVLYPIYDWNYYDVWRYIHDEQLPYSRIYDLMLKRGYSPSEMRISSLIHERSFKAIVDLPEFEPKTYARLLKRVKGIALAQEAGKNAKLHACRKLPKNFKSWLAYRDFLLQTHPDPERLPIFQRRFARQRRNEYVARQQCRQLILNDYENNLPIDDAEDPREALIRYYDEVL